MWIKPNHKRLNNKKKLRHSARECLRPWRSIAWPISGSFHVTVNMDTLGVLEWAQEEAEKEGKFTDVHWQSSRIDAILKRRMTISNLCAFTFVFILLQSAHRSLAEDFGCSGKWATIPFETSSHASCFFLFVPTSFSCNGVFLGKPWSLRLNPLVALMNNCPLFIFPRCCHHWNTQTKNWRRWRQCGVI